MAANRKRAPSVRETFVRDIENKILSGELKLGDKLPPARELCKIMGVSLTVVTAGVSELASKGFLEVRPRHGTYVADYKMTGSPETFAAIIRYNGGKLSAHEVRSFCETRMALDPFVAELVIKRASDDELAELRIFLDRLLAEDDHEAACVCITDFFRKLYSLSDNTILTLLYSSTVNPQRGMYAIYFERNGLEYMKTNAQLIYDSICARDLKAAQQHMLTGLRTPLEGPTSIID